MRFWNRPPPERLAEDLSAVRRRTDVRRGHEVASRGDEVKHGVVEGRMHVRRVAAHQRTAAEVQAARDLAKQSGNYWKLIFQGMGARNRWAVESSGEVRSLRLTALTRWSLYLGVPAMAALGVWSMTGVQAGLAILLDLDHGSPGWWAAWLLEPVIITIVAFVITAKAVLRRNGGRVRSSLRRAERGALATSILLNAVPVVVAASALPWATTWPTTIGSLLAHSIGTVGCAFVAWLIGVVDEHVADARPWDGAPSIRDLTLDIPELDQLRNPYEELLAQLERRAETEQHRPALVAQATRDDQDQGDDAAPTPGLVEGPPVAKLATPPPAAPGGNWPVVDRPIDLVPTTPPPAAPDVVVPDEIPADWLTEYNSQTNDDQGDTGTGSGSGAVAVLDRQPGVGDLIEFLAGLSDQTDASPELLQARLAAYSAAQEVLAVGRPRIEAARAYMQVMEGRGQPWGASEVARAAGLASRAQIYRLKDDQEPDSDAIED